jgi:hypothetical protein
MGNERLALVKRGFRVCCEYGQVDRMALLELQSALPDSDMRNQLVRGYVINDKPKLRFTTTGLKHSAEK